MICLFAEGQDGGFQVHQLLRVAVLYCLLEGHVDVRQHMVHEPNA